MGQQVSACNTLILAPFHKTAKIICLYDSTDDMWNRKIPIISPG